MSKFVRFRRPSLVSVLFFRATTVTVAGVAFALSVFAPFSAFAQDPPAGAPADSAAIVPATPSAPSAPPAAAPPTAAPSAPVIKAPSLPPPGAAAPAAPVASSEPESMESTSVPITPGTIEIYGGFAGIVLPENVRGTYSAQPEVRFGYFIREAVELQIQGDVRVWPLGDKAPDSYGIGGALLWFPPVHDTRNFYVLAGAGGAYTDPPGLGESGFDPLARAGFGFKVPVRNLGILSGMFLTLEYRGELVFADETDFVSGAGVGLSVFR